MQFNVGDLLANKIYIVKNVFEIVEFERDGKWMPVELVKWWDSLVNSTANACIIYRCISQVPPTGFTQDIPQPQLRGVHYS